MLLDKFVAVDRLELVFVVVVAVAVELSVVGLLRITKWIVWPSLIPCDLIFSASLRILPPNIRTVSAGSASSNNSAALWRSC